MKRSILAIAMCLAAGGAFAQDEELAPIVVERTTGNFVDCSPPNSAAACTEFHRLIRMNFTPREIGMLFGPATGYTEYKTTYDATHDRYVAFLRDIEENGMPTQVSERY